MPTTLLESTSLVLKRETSGKTSASEKLTEPSMTMPAFGSSACCLFWMAGSTLREGGSAQLAALHNELQECLMHVGGRTLEESATSGLVELTPHDNMGLSPEDAAVRLGQLLCRLAQEQRPPIRVRAAVHTGIVQALELPGSGKRAFLGPAVDSCRDLAMSAECDFAVHISSQARTGLNALQGEPLRLSRRGGSFYAEALPVDPAAKAGGRKKLADIVAEQLVPSRAPASNNSSDPSAVFAHTQDGSGAGVLGMLFRDFRCRLQEHGVDVSRFGKGDAKTLRQFYNDVAIERDSTLQVVGGELRRFKDMIRIQLLTRGEDNRLRELRIESQRRPDGSFRKRDEKLAAVLKAHESQRWKEALPQFFEERFGMNKADQTSCFTVDWDGYRYLEENQGSATIPGIKTTYRVHSIAIHIKDQSKPQLARLGMPGGLDFSTDKLTGEYRWRWVPVGGLEEEALLTSLEQVEGGPVILAPGAFGELSHEVGSCQGSLSALPSGGVQRQVRILKVWLHADILAADHVLLLDTKIQRGQSDPADKGRPLTMRMPKGQTWEQAVGTLLHKRLGITPETQLSCISVDASSHKSSEDTGVSRSYPGLPTMYQIDEVTAHVAMNAVDAATLHRIGLPDGQNFSFSRWEPAKGPGCGDMIIMHWTWQSTRDMTSVRVRRAPSMADKHSEAWLAEVREKRRHLLVPEIDGSMQLGNRGGPTASWSLFNSSTVLESLMKGKKMDMKRARRAAREICNPSYSCKDFYDDITAAFPELKLYLVGDTTSGRAGHDEYQRTLGAMFSFFWLMRLHLDGSQSFCFGLDENWSARSKPLDSSQAALEEWERRSAFHRDAEWASLEQLLVSAGLLENSTAGAGGFSRKTSFLALASRKAKDTRRHSEDRTLAMLALTAIHDIMKTVQLLPTVSRKHVSGSFRGYKVGEVINDHDAALAYILEFYPGVLPSFAALPKEQQESVKFTQSKMEYNMGWLVQAEAPPGALFRKLRRVVSSGQASPQDLAFYFTHWFTDLAGAEPFPQEGCEKFVLKFPKAVLNQFLLSFNIVQNIGLPGATETKVYEDYLAWRWDSHKPSLGPAPQGRGAIARMRLVTMAQGDSAALLQAFDRLPSADRDVLCDELSNVDIWNQSWVREETEQKGPAILVYYAPALMQKAGKEDPYRALRVLAEVLRRARELWPLSEEARSWWVSVRVDQLKELPLCDVEQPKAGKVWAVAKLTSREGAVQLASSCEAGRGDWSASHRALELAGGC